LATTIETIRKLTVIAADHGLTQLNARLAQLAAAGGNVSNAQAAMGATATTTARATASLENNVKSLERRLIPTARDAQELDKVMKSVFAGAASGTIDTKRLQALSDAAIANTSGVKAQAAEVKRLTGFINELEQKTNPTVAAQKRLLEQTVNLGNAQKMGIVSARQAADMQKRLEHNATLSAKGIGLTTSQVTQLGYQLNDVASGLLMGQSPFTIMAQQGGQVYQALKGPGGVSQGIKDATSALLAMITPARLVGTVIVAAAVEGYMAWDRFTTQQIEVTRALRTQAVYLGLTTDAFMKMAAAAGAAGDISSRTATDIATDIAKAGRFHADTLARMTAASKNYAATMGIEVPNAGKEMGKAFSSLNGILDLNANKVRFLSGPEIEHIERLWNQGKAADAAALAFSKLEQRLIPAKELTTTAASAWGMLTKNISEADRALGEYINTFSSYVAKGGRIVGDFVTPPGSVGEKLFKGGAAPKAPVATGPSPERAAMKVQVAETEEQVRALEQVMSKYVETSKEVAAADNQTREQNEYLSNQIREVGQMYKTGTDQRVAFMDAAEKIRNAEKGMSDEMYKAAQNMQGQENIMDRLVTAIRSYNSERGKGAAMTDEQVTLRAHEIELELATKLGFERRQALELEKGFLEQRGKLQTAAESEINTNRQLNLQLVQRRRAIDDDKDAMARNAEAQMQVGRAREVNLEVLQRQIQYEQQNLPLTEQEVASLKKVVEVSLQRNSVGQQMNRIYSEFKQPAIDFNNALEAATRLLKAGEINATQFGYALIDAQIRMEQASKTMEGGMKAGLLTIQRDFGDTSKLMEQFVTSSANSMVTAIADMTDGTKTAADGFRDLAKVVIRSLEEMVIKMMIVAPIAKALQGALGGGGLFGASLTGDPVFGTMHTGGIVNGNGVKRSVNPMVFAGARRYHNGGLVSGEVPAILRRNEEVLTESDPRHANNGGGGMSININVNGARGNMEIMEMVSAGVRQGISGYDASLNQGGLARKMSNVRIRGQR
jgi:phage-related minor tail protein